MSGKYDYITLRTHPWDQRINEITYSRGETECPWNLLGNWLVTDHRLMKCTYHGHSCCRCKEWSRRNLSHILMRRLQRSDPHGRMRHHNDKEAGPHLQVEHHQHLIYILHLHTYTTFKTENWKRIFSGVHNDSRRPLGAVAAFSWFRRRDISDFTYLLTVLETAWKTLSKCASLQELLTDSSFLGRFPIV